MNHDAKAVANTFYKLARGDRQRLTNMQLQKLVYIAHGFTLAMLGEPLFADPVEAWPYGPVIPKLYFEYQHLGSGEIRNRLHTTTGPVRTESREFKAVEVVWAAYGQYSGPELSAMTHKPGTPWFQIWFPRKRKRVIPNPIIASYYLQFLHSEEPPVGGMNALQQAAVLGDVETFVGLLDNLDWIDNDDEFAKAIDLAFEVGAPTAARQLFTEGIAREPSSKKLTKQAHLFPTRRPTATMSPANRTLKANREWLTAHRIEYRGEWIALRNGKLLAVAATLTDLAKKVGDTSKTLLTKA